MNSYKKNLNNWINFYLKKFFWIQVLIISLFFAQKSIAQDESIESNKNYLISQSLKFGNDPFRNILFSADDQNLIVFTSNSSIEIIRIQGGKKIRIIPSRTQDAISLVTDLSGKLAITGGEDETIRIWDTTLTTSLGILRGHLSSVSQLALFMGRQILASSSLDGTLMLWDLKELTLLNSSKISGINGVKSLTFHPEEEFIVVGGKNGTLQIRNIPDLKLIANFDAHKKTITDIEFNRRGDIFVTSSKDGKIIIWDWKERKSIFILDIKEPITDLKIHPRREEMAVVTEGGKFELWDIEKGSKINDIKKFEIPISHVDFDNNGKRILTSLDDGSIHIWEYGASLYLETLSGHDRPIESMDFSSDSKYLISSGSEKSVYLWDLGSNKKIRKFDMGKHRVQKIRFIPDSLNFITAGTNGLVKIWNHKDGKLIRNLYFHKGKINSLSLHPKDKVLLSGGSDRNWVLWDLESGEKKISGIGHSSQILTSIFSPSGDKFATAGSDLSIIVWSYPDGKELVKLDGHKKTITSLDFSPNGNFLASGSKDKKIIFWKIKPEILKNPHKTLVGHNFNVNQVLFSKGGQKLISVSKDKTMRLWGVNSGKLIRILHGDSTPLFASALSPNGKLISLSNLSDDILLFKFPSEENNSNDFLYKDIHENQIITGSNAEEFSGKVSTNTIINMDDLKEKNNNVKSEDELLVYAIPFSEKKSVQHIFKQKRLNKLLKNNNTCHFASELENLALDILNDIPHDLAAYHSLVKVSIMKGDFNILRLFLNAGNFARLDKDLYDYISFEEIKTFISRLSKEVYDQSFFRRGNIQIMKFLNCKGKYVPFNLSESSLMIHYPKEFLEKLTKIPRMIDLRDFMELNSIEFQNRIFNEINRVIENGKPHNYSRVSMKQKEVSETIPFGKLKINFEKVQSFNENGKISFLLRKEGGSWNTYSSDMDNQIVMNLQAGRYYLKVSGVLRKTFTLIPETNLYINLE